MLAWRKSKEFVEAATCDRARAMLSLRIKYVVAGLLLGLALLPASAPAIAHGLHRDGHEGVVKRSAVWLGSPTAMLVRRNALPAEASYNEPRRQDAFLPNVPLSKRGFTSSCSGAKSCLHAGGSGCCGANAGSCGMSCCASALAVSALALPNADVPALAASAGELFTSTNFGTLFRPPRSLA